MKGFQEGAFARAESRAPGSARRHRRVSGAAPDDARLPLSRVNDQTPPESVQLGRKGARAGAPGQKSASLLFVLRLIAAIRATVAAAAAADDLLEVFGVELLHLITPFELGSGIRRRGRLNPTLQQYCNTT
jgi:hypothetical protein